MPQVFPLIHRDTRTDQSLKIDTQGNGNSQVNNSLTNANDRSLNFTNQSNYMNELTYSQDQQMSLLQKVKSARNLVTKTSTQLPQLEHGSRMPKSHSHTFLMQTQDEAEDLLAAHKDIVIQNQNPALDRLSELMQRNERFRRDFEGFVPKFPQEIQQKLNHFISIFDLVQAGVGDREKTLPTKEFQLFEKFSQATAFTYQIFKMLQTLVESRARQAEAMQKQKTEIEGKFLYLQEQKEKVRASGFAGGFACRASLVASLVASLAASLAALR